MMRLRQAKKILKLHREQKRFLHHRTVESAKRRVARSEKREWGVSPLRAAYITWKEMQDAMEMNMIRSFGLPSRFDE